jgi:hypothetical protein
MQLLFLLYTKTLISRPRSYGVCGSVIWLGRMNISNEHAVTILKMEATGLFETFLLIYYTTRLRISEDHI